MNKVTVWKNLHSMFFKQPFASHSPDFFEIIQVRKAEIIAAIQVAPILRKLQRLSCHINRSKLSASGMYCQYQEEILSYVNRSIRYISTNIPNQAIKENIKIKL